MQEIIDFLSRNIFPILNILVGLLVVREALKMRRIQTEPDLIYYIKKSGSNFTGVIQNIGNGVAYNVKIHLNFDSNVSPEFVEANQEANKRKYAKTYEFLAPSQSLEFKLGWVFSSGDLGSFDAHSAQVRYTKKLDDKLNKKKIFRVNKTQIIDAGDSGTLASVAKEIKSLRMEISDIKLS